MALELGHQSMEDAVVMEKSDFRRSQMLRLSLSVGDHEVKIWEAADLYWERGGMSLVVAMNLEREGHLPRQRDGEER